MDKLEAIKILEASNALLKERIDEISSFADANPGGDDAYASLEHYKRKYEAVGLSVAALRAQPENKALICAGCEYQKRVGFNYEVCLRCKRHWDDRYKPKEVQG